MVYNVIFSTINVLLDTSGKRSSLVTKKQSFETTRFFNALLYSLYTLKSRSEITDSSARMNVTAISWQPDERNSRLPWKQEEMI